MIKRKTHPFKKSKEYQIIAKSFLKKKLPSIHKDSLLKKSKFSLTLSGTASIISSPYILMTYKKST